jgi:signal peptidase
VLSETLGAESVLDSDAKKGKRKKSSVSDLSNIFTFVVFGVLLIPIVLHSLLNITFSPVLTGSMKPNYPPGDMLITKEVPAGTLHLGDIIVLRDNKSYDLYSHRIISIVPKNDVLDISTKGDFNPTADAGVAQVAPNATVPKVIGHVHYLGRLINFFTSRDGRILSGALLGLSFLLAVVRFVARKYVREHPKSATPPEDKE